MELILRRLFTLDDTTIGTISVLGDRQPLCFTLEDEPRFVKVRNETCIPVGRYELKLRPSGGIYQRYIKRFPWNEPGMLHLQSVPGFTDILIHCGNTNADTSGCILVGDRADIRARSIGGSGESYQRLYYLLTPRLKEGARSWITVVDTAIATS